MGTIINKHKSIILIILDILIILLIYLILTFLIDVQTDYMLIGQIIMSIIIFQLYFNMFGIYKNMVKYETDIDYVEYYLATILSIFTILLLNTLLGDFYQFYKINIVAGILAGNLIILYRMIIKIKLNHSFSLKKKTVDSKRKNLLIIGAGSGARELIFTVKNRMANRYNMVGLIDDNKNKLGHQILGVEVIGSREDIPEIVKQYDVDLIFFGIYNIKPADRKEILEICQDADIKTRVFPTIEKIINEQGAFNSLRDVKIEDLLDRDVISFEDDDIQAMIRNKTVLVTGGGGSIGSELCRQIASFSPKELMILDIYENNLYDITIELKNNFPNLKLNSIVGSVRDEERLRNIFKENHPDIIFHAAAHKHVPLMENNPLEAIKNNIFGTLNVANVAEECNVSKVVLISTDKAVNPTNIMGASKRVCEMIIQAKAKTSKTSFVAVRFGNVLGSNGSVIPLFKKQIENGGPITVTHKDITRFFMTIPEAVALILQATAHAEGGEICVLDMGEPVKIYDLAMNMIKLMGYEPHIDIPIEIVGLRPGEKLYEEILLNEEGLRTTANDKIFVSNNKSIDEDKLKEDLKELKELKYEEYDEKRLYDLMRKIVPNFKNPSDVNRERRDSNDKN